MKYEYADKWYGADEELPTWLLKKIRLKIDNEQCSDCNSPFNLTLHHIIPRRRGGNNTIYNSIIKCRECHDLKHQHERYDIIARRKKLQEIKQLFTYEELHPELDMESVLIFFLWVKWVCEQNIEMAMRHPYAQHAKNWGVKH